MMDVHEHTSNGYLEPQRPRYDGDGMRDQFEQGEGVDGFETGWSHLSRGRLISFAGYVYDRFIRIRGKPKEVAWGASIGFFLAMSPTMGIQTVLGVSLAALFRVSKVAAAIAVWLTNPLSAPFIYGFNYTLGAKLLGYPLKASFFSNPSWASFWCSGGHVFVALTVGGTVTGFVAALVGYFIVLGMVKTARKKARQLKRKRHE